MIESKRIEVVDALRGFAILAIVLLHNMEHFEYNQVSDALPAWLLAIDKHVVTIMYFLFGGKAYAIFALIFGFSFYKLTIKKNLATIIHCVLHGVNFYYSFLGL
jgi:uncharacterized protein